MGFPATWMSLSASLLLNPVRFYTEASVFFLLIRSTFNTPQCISLTFMVSAFDMVFKKALPAFGHEGIFQCFLLEAFASSVWICSAPGIDFSVWCEVGG